jgi:hypothetical protein
VRLTDYTTTISYKEGNPVAESEVRDELGRINDFEMVPFVPIEQLTPTTSLQLDVYFDGSSSCLRCSASSDDHVDVFLSAAYSNGVNR